MSNVAVRARVTLVRYGHPPKSLGRQTFVVLPRRDECVVLPSRPSVLLRVVGVLHHLQSPHVEVMVEAAGSRRDLLVDLAEERFR